MRLTSALMDMHEKGYEEESSRKPRTKTGKHKCAHAHGNTSLLLCLPDTHTFYRISLTYIDSDMCLLTTLSQAALWVGSDLGVTTHKKVASKSTLTAKSAVNEVINVCSGPVS